MFERPEKSDSMVSSSTRLAPTVFDRVLEPNEQAFEVIFAGLLDLGALDVHVIDEELLLGDEAREIESERGHVRRDFLRGLLEEDGHPGLVVLGGSPDQELDPEQRLAGSGASTDQGRATAGQASAGEIIEPCDPGGCLGDSFGRSAPGWLGLFFGHGTL